MSAAIEYKPKLSGSASGLVGFIQIGFGALGAFLISLVKPSVSSLSWLLILFVMSGIVIFTIKLSTKAGKVNEMA